MTPEARDSVRRERRELALLLALAAVVRLAYLIEYAELPFLRTALYDSVVYLRQADAVASGRFGDASLVAFSPLYGYFLAAFGATSSLLAPVIAQLVLGCGTVALVYVAGRRAFGHRAGLCSAALLVGYGLVLSYETKLLSESLGLLLCVGATALWLTPGSAVGRLAPSIGAGAVLGLAVLGRASLVFTPPFFLLAALVPWSRGEGAPPLRARLQRTGGLAAGLALVLVGHGAWTYAHTGFFVPVIMVSNTVRTSTSADVRGDLSAFSTRADGAVSPMDVVRQAEERIQLGPDADAAQAPPVSFDLGGFLAAAPGKVWRTLGDYELTFYQYGYYGERTEVRTLGVLPVSFGMFLLLGLVGAVALARDRGWRALVPYVPFVLGPLVTTSLFHPDSRYRLAMIVPCALLAGAGLVATARIADRRRRIAAGALVGAVCAVLAFRTLTYELRQPAVWELSVAEAAAKIPDHEEVARRIERARAAAPGDPGIERRIEYVLRRLPP